MRNMSIITTAATVGLALALPPAERGFAAGWAVRWGVERRGRLSGCRRREGLQLALFRSSRLGRADRPLSVADQLGDGSLSGRIRPDGQALLTMVGRTGSEELTK